VTWTQTSAPGEDWNSIASSSDGTKLAAAWGWGGGGTGGIYTSTNAGVTWTQTSAPDTVWDSIASSSDGTKLAAAPYEVYNDGMWGPGGIFTSTNAGLTWTQTIPPGEVGWSSIASSSDGTKLAAVVSFTGIWTSTNAGVTWTQTSAPGSPEWQSIASSSDGTHLAAVGWPSGIWTAQATIQTTTAPRLAISYSGNSVIVSWPNNGSYNLQQNSNLAAPDGWTTSGYPISTGNGTNSISVTPSPGTLFFRLTQP
jgi:hypothetical protein